MKTLIRQGPVTIVLIYSPQCPHCHTYMPLWNRLCKQSERRANLIHMEAPVYNQLELSEKKSIDGVPTVLFVDKEGRVSEAESPRDERVMTNAVRLGVSEKEAATASVSEAKATSTIASDSDIFTPVSAAPSELTTETPFVSSMPGVMMSESELPAIPGAVIPSASVQSGGSPWAAFLATARHAAPAVALLGAYSLLRKPASRSSGLAKGKGRKTYRRHSRRKSQQRNR
jgi:thiol-disulfide isomerase/thioredoxin